MNVLTCKDKYKALLNYLLHNVCIADEMNMTQVGNAVLIQKDGTGFKTSKRIVGGSVGLFEGNKIGRTQTIGKIK